MEPINGNGKERREYIRHLLRCQWRGVELPLLETSARRDGIIKAWVENISSGGIGLLTEKLTNDEFPLVIRHSSFVIRSSSAVQEIQYLRARPWIQFPPEQPASHAQRHHVGEYLRPYHPDSSEPIGQHERRSHE